MSTPNRLPNGWAWMALDQITRNFDALRRPVKASHRESMAGEYPYYGASGIIDSVNSYLFDGDYLLIAEDGANLLSRSTPIAFQAHSKFWVNNHAHVVQTLACCITSYLEHYLNSIDLKFLITGSAQPKLTQANLATIPIPVPPVAEQRRIVAAIEQQFTRLDAGVAALKRTRATLKRYRAAVLKAAVEGKLTEEWRAAHPDVLPATTLLARILAERRARWEADLRVKGKDPAKANYEEPKAPDIANQSELPEGWCWATLDQGGFLNRGRFSVRPRNDPRYFGGSYPFIQIGDLPIDGGPIQAFKQTLNEDGIKVSRTFAPGTVVISIAAAIGRVGLLSFESCFPDSLVGLTCTPELIPQFAEMFLRTQTDYLKGQSYASGGQPNISLPVLESLPIPLPPLDEQEQIIAEVERRFSVVSELETTVEASLKRAERLRQSILELAFSGRLVPQDPTDEPASALLARIREELISAHSMNSQAEMISTPNLWTSDTSFS